MDTVRAVTVDSPTEARNPHTTDIDQIPTLDILRELNTEDQTVAAAVATVLPQIAEMVDHAVWSLRRGGRVHYVGAGTSGRLATLDAAELIPTFNIPADWFVVHQAGGPTTLKRANANAEDDAEAGAAEIDRTTRTHDFVIGLSASGRTPYVLSALATAHRRGLRTALVSANPTAPAADVDVTIAVATGPEAIAGSTRLKAGTAQKLLLNAFSTAVMIRLGRTYSNLMVSLTPTNTKLRARAARILLEATGLPESTCHAALAAANDDLKVALVHLLAEVDPTTACTALTASGGHVRIALAALRGHPTLHPEPPDTHARPA